MSALSVRPKFLFFVLVFCAALKVHISCDDKLKAVNRALIKQLRMQQLIMEEDIRLQGSSGIKRMRQYRGGNKPYHFASFSSYKMLSIHNHADHINTVGLGELSVVLNGVQFRTRHNDYQLKRPHSSSRVYGAVEDIPMPPVPPEVLRKRTLKEQVAEMKEWFKAWRDNNAKVRDFRKYFPAVLCYLEGTWVTTDNDDKLEEPFTSDRHLVEARTWDELFQKVEFTSYSGHKNERENFAFMPTRIMGITNDSIPLIGQWTYRILCHKPRFDLLKNRLKPIDDFHLRVPYDWTEEQHLRTNAMRFQVNSENSDKFKDAHNTFGLLDRLMEQIPGMNNYRGRFLADSTFGVYARHFTKGSLLHAGSYHRYYKVNRPGAMGTQVRHRGYNDPNIFFAKNTQKRVIPVSVEDKCRGRPGKMVCDYKTEERWSFAIPLEVIYLTPLSSWNPHRIRYRGDYKSTEGRKATANGRNGGKSRSKAFDGMNSRTFYMTPAEMFQGEEVNQDVADTAKYASVGMLNSRGQLVNVAASGTRVFFPNIPGVGILRQRYPIAPIAEDGSTIWKELQAIKDYLFTPSDFPKISKERGEFEKKEVKKEVKKPSTNSLPPGFYQMEYAKGKMGYHTHTIRISTLDLNILFVKRQRINVVTSTESGHTHTLRIGVRYKRKGSFEKELYYVTCDQKATCFDGHGVRLIKADYD